MTARSTHHPSRPRKPWRRRGVRVAAGLVLVALGLGLAFDAGRQSVRKTAALGAAVPAVEAPRLAGTPVGPVATVPSRVADPTPAHLDSLRLAAPALQAVPLGRRVPTENACGSCHRIADPPILPPARPMM